VTHFGFSGGFPFDGLAQFEFEALFWAEKQGSKLTRCGVFFLWRKRISRSNTSENLRHRSDQSFDLSPQIKESVDGIAEKTIRISLLLRF
jgi:hypothetical protein